MPIFPVESTRRYSSSIFGMMFETQEDYAIVESTEFSLLQHNPFSWVVDGCDFVYCERLSAGARYVDGSIREMLLAVLPSERERFVDALFSVFELRTPNGLRISQEICVRVCP